MFGVRNSGVTLSESSNETDRPLVLYHGPSCQDGHASAWVARTVLGDGADYLPVNYGDPAPDLTFRPLFILDFCFPLADMLGMARECTSMVVLDHHVTQKDTLAALVRETCLWTDKVKVRYHAEKCGSRLAWEHFRPEADPPFLLDVVQSRDLWTWSAPYAREIDAWLASRPRTFDEWDRISAMLERPYLSSKRARFDHEWLEPGRDQGVDWYACPYTMFAVQSGRVALAYRDALVAQIARHAREVEIDGYKVLAANTPVLQSEVAGALAADRPFGAVWYLDGQGRKLWSLRSREGGVDVSEIAKRRPGGGGHFAAAGYTEDLAGRSISTSGSHSRPNG